MHPTDDALSEDDARRWAGFERQVKDMLPLTDAKQLLEFARAYFLRDIAQRRRREQDIAVYFRRALRRAL